MKLFKAMKRPVTLAITAMMAISLIPASPISAKTKYNTKTEDGKEYIILGSYEQDGDESNGKEPIEWEVLGKDKNGILVVSRYILTCQPYNKKSKGVTWETCTLRKWLNKTFYNKAFSAKEKQIIKKNKVKNLDTTSGETVIRYTKDRIFCLSKDEVLKYYELDVYFDENNKDKDGAWGYGYGQSLMTSMTRYATESAQVWPHKISQLDDTEKFSRYGYTADSMEKESHSWWLRTSDGDSISDFVTFDGNVGCGTFVESNSVGVRPAMYLKK